MRRWFGEIVDNEDPNINAAAGMDGDSGFDPVEMWFENGLSSDLPCMSSSSSSSLSTTSILPAASSASMDALLASDDCSFAVDVMENLDLICNGDDDIWKHGDGDSTSELASIFYQWLKQNKDYICAQDLRNIKLKRSTIETASKRLGKKQLLKLILQWVEQYQLQNKKTNSNFLSSCNSASHQSNFLFCNSAYPPASQPHVNVNVGGDYPCYSNVQPWCNHLPPQYQATNYDDTQYYPYHQLFHFHGNVVASKEARKNRMARHRRHSTHHHPYHNQNAHNLLLSHTWSYCSAPSPPSIAPLPDRVDTPLLVESQQQQGEKTQNNLKFLLQKVLKQSDVGNLGRIVLPKREAESNLPQLESRDGISIAMEDIGTSRVWNIKYRFWPNNKSRMYLLENTGEFVRANGLQEGDFIVIYADTKCGKYLIRGVKVGQSGPKP